MKLTKCMIKKLTFPEFKTHIEQLRSSGQGEDANELIKTYWSYKKNKYLTLLSIRDTSGAVLLMNVAVLLMKAYSLPKEELLSWAVPIGVLSLISLFGLAVPIIFPKRQYEADEVEPYYRDMIRRNVFKNIFE